MNGSADATRQNKHLKPEALSPRQPLVGCIHPDPRLQLVTRDRYLALVRRRLYIPHLYQPVNLDTIHLDLVVLMRAISQQSHLAMLCLRLVNWSLRHILHLRRLVIQVIHLDLAVLK